MATRAETTLRVEQVAEWLLERTPYREVLRKAAEAWGVSGRQADTYIAKARVFIREQAGARLQDALLETASQYDLLTYRGFQTNPWIALVAIQAKARLLGLEKVAGQDDGEPDRIVFGEGAGFQPPAGEGSDGEL